MTRVPRGVSARRLIRALAADGFALQRVSGSHRIYRHVDGRRVVVAYHDTVTSKDRSSTYTEAPY